MLGLLLPGAAVTDKDNQVVSATGVLPGVYVCMYVCMCMCVCVYLCSRVWVYSVYVCLRAYVCQCLCISVCVSVSVWMTLSIVASSGFRVFRFCPLDKRVEEALAILRVTCAVVGSGHVKNGLILVLSVVLTLLSVCV